LKYPSFRLLFSEENKLQCKRRFGCYPAEPSPALCKL
jgi:hypothetical protein